MVADNVQEKSSCAPLNQCKAILYTPPKIISTKLHHGPTCTFPVNGKNEKMLGMAPISKKISLPCASRCTTQVDGAKCKLMAHNAALYCCSGLQRRSHKPWGLADGQTTLYYILLYTLNVLSPLNMQSSIIRVTIMMSV